MSPTRCECQNSDTGVVDLTFARVSPQVLDSECQIQNRTGDPIFAECPFASDIRQRDPPRQDTKYSRTRTLLLPQHGHNNDADADGSQGWTTVEKVKNLYRTATLKKIMPATRTHAPVNLRPGGFTLTRLKAHPLSAPAAVRNDRARPPNHRRCSGSAQPAKPSQL